MPFQFHKDTRQPDHKAHGPLANYSEGRVGQMPCPKALIRTGRRIALSLLCEYMAICKPAKEPHKTQP